MGIGRHPQGGFAYLVLLLAVALIGVTASAALNTGAAIARRDAELQLLAIGLEFQRALHSYAGVPLQSSAAAASRGPRTIDELVRDPRVPGIRRHLRQLYADPLTGRNEWGLVRDAQGYILGIYSLADGQPIRRRGFEASLAGFEDAESYSQWIFGLRFGAGPQGRPSGTNWATVTTTFNKD